MSKRRYFLIHLETSNIRVWPVMCCCRIWRKKWWSICLWDWSKYKRNWEGNVQRHWETSTESTASTGDVQGLSSVHLINRFVAVVQYSMSFLVEHAKTVNSTTTRASAIRPGTSVWYLIAGKAPSQMATIFCSRSMPRYRLEDKYDNGKCSGLDGPPKTNKLLLSWTCARHIRFLAKSTFVCSTQRQASCYQVLKNICLCKLWDDSN